MEAVWERSAERSADMRCPLLRGFYTPKEALRESASNINWKALYGQYSIDLGIEIAKRRSRGEYLRGYPVFRWLADHHALNDLAPDIRSAADLLFSDPGGIKNQDRVYDLKKDRFFDTDLILRKALLGMKPLFLDIEVYRRDEENIFFLKGPGQKVLLPFGSKILFLGPFKHDDEEIFVPDSEVKNGCIVTPSVFVDSMKVEERQEGIIFQPLS